MFDAKYDENDIEKKIKKAIQIKRKISKIKNLHGDGTSSKRIYNILKKININQSILNKNTTY